MTHVRTKQEMFDIVVKALRLQGCKSQTKPEDPDDLPSCKYRGPHDTKCAAGHLIPDELMKPGMENKTITAVIRDFPDVRPYFGIAPDATMEERKTMCEFAQRLQGAHDSSEPRAWETNWEIIAERHHLTMPAKEDGYALPQTVES